MPYSSTDYSPTISPLLFLSVSLHLSSQQRVRQHPFARPACNYSWVAAKPDQAPWTGTTLTPLQQSPPTTSPLPAACKAAPSSTISLLSSCQEPGTAAAVIHDVHCVGRSSPTSPSHKTLSTVTFTEGPLFNMPSTHFSCPIHWFHAPST